MGRHQLVSVTLCSLACIVYTNYSASAGWFGPSNYNECVLDKESDRMLSPLQVLDIESACRGLFPPEPKEKETLLDDTGRTIHYRNCSDETGEFKLCVTEKPDGF